jgi:hypothetical protein
MSEPKSDQDLAKIIGTHRKSFRRWREQFPEECPKTLDPEEWRKFLSERLLGPYSAQRNYGEDAGEAEKEQAQPAPTPSPWERKSLAPVAKLMIALAESLTDGSLSLLEYFRQGTEVIEAAHNGKARRVWIDLCLNRLAEMFPTPAAAAKEFSEMVIWLHRQAARR